MSLLLLLIVTRLDVVEAELVRVLGRSDDANPVTELVLLQELLGKVLEVALGKWDAGSHRDADITYASSQNEPTQKEQLRVITLAGDLHVLTELASLSLDLDTVMKVLLKGRTVKDTIASRTGVVNDELVLRSSLGGGGLGLERKRKETQYEPTEKVTQQSGTGAN